ncbi:MAG TPA: type II toxin-antitoxin system prevent-host-death family antitoxin [Ilumatobacter sp.]|nr:type II toxin-antitoxin system prevent-host-death family antitoxin [Ilumatobacter sp.]
MDVGVRELKQHLSEYLERVASGETIRVTDRGTPKALLSPIQPNGELQRGIDEGWIRPGNGRALTPVQAAHSDRKIRELLNEDRDD